MKICILTLFSMLIALSSAKAFDISAADTILVADRVFKNECSIEKDCFLEWNENESFLSLGLEHFIWYPKDAPNIFNEGFISYLDYARKAGEKLPDWLDKTPFPPCPWSSREEFINSKGSPKYNDLMAFMVRTKHCQAQYLIDHTRLSLEQIINASPFLDRGRVSEYIAQLTNNAQGLYSIIDYLNFKGAGIGQSEVFNGQGWGLLQVLQGMHDTPTPQETLQEFVRSARIVLRQRVFYAPAERHEERWLPGWLKRINTYLL